MYRLSDQDYLDLWKYFQTRADDVKGAMFQTVTWSLGIASAIVGFIVAQVASADIGMKGLYMMFGAAGIGICLCLYSWYLVRESKKHIRRNWDRAEFCEAHVNGLYQIVHPEPQKKRKYNLMSHVWNQLLAAVIGFGLSILLLVGLVLWAKSSPFCISWRDGF